jgi:hypothetical protein
MATVARIERLGKMFEDYRVVIYENDSTDGTDIVLKEWESQNYKVKIVSEKLGDVKYESITDAKRLAALANYRNHYLEDIFDKGTIVPDYIIVTDLDLPGGWSYEGICNSFGYDHWSVMGSNGLLYGILEGSTDNEMRRIYYDSLAFRRKGHPEPHVSSDINAIVYNRGESPIQVDSCFGGMAIYKSGVFKHGARYSGPDCDHVELHRRMLDTGIDEIYLNPSQIVLYSNVHYTVV